MNWLLPLSAPKKDGGLRFYFYSVKLNMMTIKYSYLLPRIGEYIGALRDSKVLRTLDAYNGYLQVLLAPHDRHKTSSVCHTGTYQYIRMPFRLKNAPATDQCSPGMVLTNIKCKTFLVYMDEVMIY